MRTKSPMNVIEASVHEEWLACALSRGRKAGGRREGGEGSLRNVGSKSNLNDWMLRRTIVKRPPYGRKDERTIEKRCSMGGKANSWQVLAVPTGMQVQVRRSRYCKRASEETLPVAAISVAAALPLVSGSDADCLFTSKTIRLHNSLPHNPINKNQATKYTH